MSLAAQLLVPSVKHLLAVEDERKRQLDAIQRTVQAQLEGPYRAGLIELRLASTPGTTPIEASERVKRAEALFIQALGNFETVEPLQAAWARLQLAGISLLDQQRDAALG